MSKDVDIDWDFSNMLQKKEQIQLRIIHETEITGDELAEEIEEHTYPYVPFLHGYLEGSFTAKMLTPVPLLRMEVQYSAISNDYFDYAEPQHNKNYDHPVRKPGKKPKQFFLRIGMFEVQQEVEEIYGRRIRNALR